MAMQVTALLYPISRIITFSYSRKLCLLTCTSFAPSNHSPKICHKNPKKQTTAYYSHAQSPTKISDHTPCYVLKALLDPIPIHLYSPILTTVPMDPYQRVLSVLPPKLPATSGPSHMLTLQPTTPVGTHFTPLWILLSEGSFEVLPGLYYSSFQRKFLELFPSSNLLKTFPQLTCSLFPSLSPTKNVFLLWHLPLVSMIPPPYHPSRSSG